MTKTILKVSLGIAFAFCAYPFVDNAYKWNACVRQFKDLEWAWKNQVNALGVAVCNGAGVQMIKHLGKK